MYILPGYLLLHDSNSVHVPVSGCHHMKQEVSEDTNSDHIGEFVD